MIRNFRYRSNCIDRLLTIHQAQRTGRPKLWLSEGTEIYD